MTVQEILHIRRHASNILGRPETEIDLFINEIEHTERLNKHSRFKLNFNKGTITYYFYIQHFDKDKIIKTRYLHKIVKKPWVVGNEYVQLWCFPGDIDTHDTLYETMQNNDFRLIFEVE